MFPAYAGPSGGSNGRKDNESDDDNLSRYSSFELKKLEEKRKAAEQRRRFEEEQQQIMDYMVIKRVHAHSDDSDSDNITMVPNAFKAVMEKIADSTVRPAVKSKRAKKPKRRWVPPPRDAPAPLKEFGCANRPEVTPRVRSPRGRSRTPLSRSPTHSRSRSPRPPPSRHLRRSRSKSRTRKRNRSKSRTRSPPKRSRRRRSRSRTRSRTRSRSPRNRARRSTSRSSSRTRSESPENRTRRSRSRTRSRSPPNRLRRHRSRSRTRSRSNSILSIESDTDIQVLRNDSAIEVLHQSSGRRRHTESRSSHNHKERREKDKRRDDRKHSRKHKKTKKSKKSKKSSSRKRRRRSSGECSSTSSSSSSSESNIIQIDDGENGQTSNVVSPPKPQTSRPLSADEKYTMIGDHEDLETATRLGKAILWSRGALKSDEVLLYESCYPRERSKTRQPNKFLMPPRLQKIFYHDPKEVVKENWARCYEMKTNERKKECLFRTMTALKDLNLSDLDYVLPLSKERLTEIRFASEIEDEKIRRKNEEQRRLEKLRDLGGVASNEMIDVELKLDDLRVKLSTRKRDAELYLEFVELEDRKFDLMVRESRAMADRKGLNERKLAILENALKACPSSVELHMKYISIQKETLDTEKLLAEWRTLLNRFVNRCVVWSAYLDMIQFDSKIYTPRRMDAAFDLCTDKLSNIYNGIMVSHPVEEGTQTFLLNLFLRRLRWWMDSGFTERAIASIQATMEYHCCPPESLSEAYDNERMASFEKYWNSALPRLGDRGWGDPRTSGPDSWCWSRFHDTFIAGPDNFDANMIQLARQLERVEIETETMEKIAIEQRVSAEKSVNESWVQLERELADLYVRPRRTEPIDEEDKAHCSDPYRRVAWEEVRICLTCESTVIFDLLVLLGCTVNKLYTPMSPACLLVRDWDASFTTPSMTPSVTKRALRMMRQLATRFNSVQLAYSLVSSYGSYLDQLGPEVTAKEREKELRKFVREIFEGEDRVPFMDEGNVHLLTLSLLEVLMTARWNTWSTSNKLKKCEQYLMLALKPVNAAGGFAASGYLQTQLVFSGLLLAVQCIETSELATRLSRWILRYKPERKINSVDILSATKHLESIEEQESVFLVASDEKETSSQMEPMRELVRSIRVVLYYATCTKEAPQDWLPVLRNMATEKGFDTSQPVRDTLVEMLLRHWKTHHTLKTELCEELKKHARDFPTSPKALKWFVSLYRNSGVGGAWLRALSSIDEFYPVGRQDRHNVIWVTLAKLSMKRTYSEVDTSAHGQGGQFGKTCCEKAMALQEPVFWRMAIQHAVSATACEMVHVRATDHCKWAREVHVDRIASPHSTGLNCDNARLLMEEAGVRCLVGDMEEVEVLRESAIARAAAAAEAEDPEEEVHSME